MSFDHSYTFQKGTQWVRTPNIFNLSNDILVRVESGKKNRYIHKQKKIDCDPDEIIQSDIIPQSRNTDSKSMKKTVNIEIGDMDLENFDFHTPREENIGNESSSSNSQNQASLQTKEVVEDIDPDDSMNKLSIKNYELAKKFMKGRQFGRESTPSRSKEVKEQRNKLSKINIAKYEDLKKAWDDDSQINTPGDSLDKVESLESSKPKKITRLNIKLKQFHSKVKVVRVHSVRKVKSLKSKTSKDKTLDRIKKSSKRSRHHDMPPLPVSKMKSLPAFVKGAMPEKLELDKATRFCNLVEKQIIKKLFNKWKNNCNIKDSNALPGLFKQSSNESKHKKKVSEFIQKPFSLLLLTSASDPVEKGSNSKDSKGYTQIDEEIKEEVSDKELFKHALSQYEKLAEKPKSGFKVFNISQETSKHEISKSVVIEDFMKRKIKHKKMDKSQNYGKSKHLQLSGHQKDEKDPRNQKKTKDALKRYKQISHMLEKIQTEANKLNSEYQRNQKDDEKNQS